MHFSNIIGSFSAKTFAAWLPPSTRIFIFSTILLSILLSEKLIICLLRILPISQILYLYLLLIPLRDLFETKIFEAKGNKYLFAFPMIKLFFVNDKFYIQNFC